MRIYHVLRGNIMKYISEQFELDFRKYKGILAMAKNRCIGKDDTIPWRHKEDFQWFKEFTRCDNGEKTLIMGSKTASKLPILKDRRVYVLTKRKLDMCRTVAYCGDNYIISWATTIDELPKGVELIVAGGKSIYELFIPKISEFYVTHIDKEYEGDTFMFPFEHLFTKQEVIREFDFGKVIKYSK
jgi:dihydrofolate reductase